MDEAERVRARRAPRTAARGSRASRSAAASRARGSRRAGSGPRRTRGPGTAARLRACRDRARGRRGDDRAARSLRARAGSATSASCDRISSRWRILIATSAVGIARRRATPDRTRLHRSVVRSCSPAISGAAVGKRRRVRRSDACFYCRSSVSHRKMVTLLMCYARHGARVRGVGTGSGRGAAQANRQ